VAPDDVRLWRAQLDADDVIRGPAALVRVTFDGLTREVTMTVRCVDGVAESTVGPG
jgi:hypothetical protein